MSLLMPFLLPIATSLISVFIKGRMLIGINLISSFALLVFAM